MKIYTIVIALLIFSVYSSIAQNITTPTTAEVEEMVEAEPVTTTVAEATTQAPDKIKEPVKTTIPTPKAAVPIKTVIPAKTTTKTVVPAATTLTPKTVAPVKTVAPTKAVKMPTPTKTTTKAVVPKQTIKPATALTPTAKPSKLPPTVTSTAPRYTSTTSSSSWTGTVVDEYKTMHELMGDRIHIGLRSMTFSLDETSRVGQDFDDYFLGTIDELHEVQDSSLANVTLGFYPVRNIGIEYRRDVVEARTTTDTDDNHSDGNFKVDGPVFLGIARLPLDQIVTLFNMASGDDTDDKDSIIYNITRRIIPYIGFGKAALSGEFNADTWWANGYSSPESWESLGSPEGITRNGHTRSIKVTDEDVGMYLVYGLSLRIVDNFYADFSFSKVDVDLTADFALDEVYQYTRTIPMSYTSTSLGIRYYF